MVCQIKKRTVRDPNEIVLKENYAEIILYNIKCEEVGRAKIDFEDIDKAKKYKWCINKCSRNKYVFTQLPKSKKHLYLHKHLIKHTKHFDIDHKNGNGLDNRRSNLRIVSRQHNLFNCRVRKNNTSGITGVYWDKSHKKWYARISFNGKVVTLGWHKEKEEAIKLRNKGKEKFHRIQNLNKNG